MSTNSPETRRGFVGEKSMWQDLPKRPDVNVGIDNPLANIAAALYDPADPDNRIGFRPLPGDEKEFPHIEGVWGVVRVTRPDGTIQPVGIPIRKLPELGRRITEYLGNNGKVPALIVLGPDEELLSERWLSTKFMKNNRWLYKIGAENHHPIEVSRYIHETHGDSIGNGYRADIHDSSTEHFANALLQPSVWQTQVCEAALLELNNTAIHSGRKSLVFTGEDEESVFPYMNFATFLMVTKTNGVGLIDEVTGYWDYINILETFATFPSASEVDAVIDKIVVCGIAIDWDGRQNMEKAISQLKNAGLDDRYEAIDLLQRTLNEVGNVQGLANFNMRHYEGRNLKPDEARQVARNYVEGVREIAHLIRGDVEEKVAA